jgi:phosphatidate cytidylyltransferase
LSLRDDPRAAKASHAAAPGPAAGEGAGETPAPPFPLPSDRVAGGVAPAAVPKRSSWSLALRIASGILFVPLLVLLARAGHETFLAFVGLQVGLATSEFYRMMRGKGLAPYGAFGTLASLGLLWLVYRPHLSPADFLATSLLLLALAFGLRRPDHPRLVEGIAVTLFGVIYVGWLSAHLVLLRELPWRAGTAYGDGASYVLLAFLVTWSCDTGAFAVGKAFGRTRPWTRISPLKSVEGSIGGFLFAIAAAFLARAWFAPYLTPWDAWALGILVGVFAQVGDLVESLFKRDAQHGDSSDLIPGHGGVLDRFDSLYFSAPIVYYYLKLKVFGVP